MTTDPAGGDLPSLRDTTSAGATVQPGPSHYAILAIAVPVIFSNASTPLLGIVDTAVMGQLGPAYLIGAVAVGAIVFDFVFWAFGFLRMGTTALAAQADGAGDATAVRSVLARALLIAAVAGLTVIALQVPITWLAFLAMPASAAVEDSARIYVDIRIWSAPLVFANYAIAGFMIGRGKAWQALLLQLTLNLSNIALNLVLVIGYGLGIAGVAIGSVCAEALALLLGLVLLRAGFLRDRVPRDGVSEDGGQWRRADILDPVAIGKTLALNGNIMIRSMCLMFAFAFFTARGADQGDVTLAANAIGMHFILLSAYMLDGFAFSAERYVGKGVGARDWRAVHTAAVRTTQWSAGVAALIAALGWLAGDAFIAMMTVNPDVRAATLDYWGYAALAPLAGFMSYQLDGVYIGAARGRDMRNMMIVALLVYLAGWYLLTQVAGLGNDGLWGALWLFFASRAATLAALYPALLADVEQSARTEGLATGGTGQV